MCEQLGMEPDPKRMPPSTADLPEEVQHAFMVFNYMSDRWDGMSGSYLGKDWSSVEFFLNLWSIEDKKLVVFFLSNIESVYSKKLNDKQEQRRKAEERKSKAGGKTYAHNVQG
tara:strand:- start:82 stop:420 length:339 start_codon:yes stop_codon:yes gene_type:complete